MKKIIAITLSLLMLFSVVSVSAAAAEGDELVITVANDLHYSLKKGDYTSEDFSHISSTGQMNIESVLIIKEFLKQAAANESDCILLPGDLVDVGNEESFAGMSALLKDFEATSGKPVYVIPGNHEFYTGETAENFVSYFYEFGYNEAIARDTLSASYVVDLNEEYRLIAIDGAATGAAGNAMTAERIAWIEEQAKLAHQEGKKTIAMNHFNLLQHFMFRDVLHKNSVIDSSFGLAEIFAKYNVKYTFCGHTHDHDIASYTGSNGNVIYDVVTSSINAYPCPYRVVTFGDDVIIETRNITSLSEDTSALQPMLSEYCYNLLNEDFAVYAEECMDAGLTKTVDSYFKASKIKSILGLDATEDAEMCALLDELVPEVTELVHLPLYEKDAAEEGRSIEAMAKKHDMSLVFVEAETFADIGKEFYKAIIVGDENYGLLSPMFNAFHTAAVVIVAEVLADVSAEEYTMVLDFACEFLGVGDYTGFFTKYTGDGIARLEGVNYFVSSVLCAVMLQVTTDKAPGDNNVILPGYVQATVEEPEKPAEPGFFEKVLKFFKDAFYYLLRILGF